MIDTGKGMNEEACIKAFDPFYTTKKNRSGLGLPIVFGMVQQKKGTVTVASKENEGSTFSIVLPARRKAKRKTGRPPRTGAAHNGTETILVVDDERITTKSTARFLQRRGYHTLMAFDGKEALEVFRKNESSIDLVLLDLEMPELNGNQCLAAMLAIRPELKSIAMSGHFIDPGPGNPVKAGAKAFIAKPYDAE